nr:immunoglobulin heavy chain junction region [Mus musculus]
CARYGPPGGRPFYYAMDYW